MKEHIRKFHTFETPYECTECDKKFSVLQDLKRHGLKHGIGAKVFCQKCNKGYLQNYELVRHQNYCLKQ
jgi:KRAB domain-containing zinc finger protein